MQKISLRIPLNEMFSICGASDSSEGPFNSASSKDRQKVFGKALLASKHVAEPVALFSFINERAASKLMIPDVLVVPDLRPFSGTPPIGSPEKRKSNEHTPFGA